jgi:hypothetical protein
MTIQIDFLDPEPMCLEDAMAYEFFMDNVSICFQDKEQNGEDLAISLAVLAKSAYLIAEIFTEARNQHIEKTNGTV